MEHTMAELIAARDRADEAGNEALYQHYCARIDQLENEKEV